MEPLPEFPNSPVPTNPANLRFPPPGMPVATILHGADLPRRLSGYGSIGAPSAAVGSIGARYRGGCGPQPPSAMALV